MFNGIPSVWGEMNEELLPVVPAQSLRVPSSLGDHDPVSGSTYVDEDFRLGRTHGRTRSNVANTQTPVPVAIGGGTGTGVFSILTAMGEMIAKVPAMMAAGGDVVGTVYRGQRYRAIQNVRPESTGTIGAVARQSYQYVRPLVPYPFPSNAFGNPNIATGQVRQIEDTIPPALEPPRYNLTGMDTNYLQQQHDLLLTKARLAERGMG